MTARGGNHVIFEFSTAGGVENKQFAELLVSEEGRARFRHAGFD